MMGEKIYQIILVIIISGYLLDQILDILNRKSWKKTLPDKLKEFYDEEKYATASHYSRVNFRFSFIQSAFSFLLILIFYVLGGFGRLNSFLACSISNKILLALAFYGILFIISDLLATPFSIYNTFVIEEKFGFNKTTYKTFILDKLKGWLLTLILGGGLVSLLLWLVYLLGNHFWLVAYAAIILISLIMNFFYGSVILPLFNKLRPLEEGELRTAIENFAQKVNFPLNNIYVMDGSKRSSKANAFFTGFWKKKKIVLYDTLIQKHTTDELVAVLAHEAGHYKKKHVLKNMAVSAVQTFVMFYVLSLLIFNKSLSEAFRAEGMVVHINLIAFAILYEPVSLILGLAGNYFSRKQEFQADEFAVKATGKTNLPNALKKLSVDQLSNLLPHPVYVFFHYSHPPLIQRLEAMNKTEI